MIEPPIIDDARQAWLQSLKEGDTVLVHLNGEKPFESIVKSSGGGNIKVKDAGSSRRTKGGRRSHGWFSKIHGYRYNHNGFLHWQDGDFIVPVSSPSSEPISLGQLVSAILDIDKNIVGFKIKNIPISKTEAEQILEQLHKFITANQAR